MIDFNQKIKEITIDEWPYQILDMVKLKKILEDEGKLSNNAINHILYDVHRSNLISEYFKELDAKEIFKPQWLDHKGIEAVLYSGKSMREHEEKLDAFVVQNLQNNPIELYETAEDEDLLYDEGYFDHLIHQIIDCGEQEEDCFTKKFIELGPYYLMKFSPSRKEERPLRYISDFAENFYRAGSYYYNEIIWEDFYDCMPKVINFNREFPVFHMNKDEGCMRGSFSDPSHLYDKSFSDFSPPEEFWSLCEVIWNLRLFNFQRSS